MKEDLGYIPTPDQPAEFVTIPTNNLKEMATEINELREELRRLRRVEQYLNELLGITGESPDEWITNVGAKMYDIKKALDNG